MAFCFETSRWASRGPTASNASPKHGRGMNLPCPLRVNKVPFSQTTAPRAIVTWATPCSRMPSKILKSHLEKNLKKITEIRNSFLTRDGEFSQKQHEKRRRPKQPNQRHCQQQSLLFPRTFKKRRNIPSIKQSKPFLGYILKILAAFVDVTATNWLLKMTFEKREIKSSSSLPESKFQEQPHCSRRQPCGLQCHSLH